MKYLLLVIALITITRYAKSEDFIIEYGLEEVFIVPSGYDTNDNIEITLTTKLPNSCFTPYKTQIKKLNNLKFHLDFFIKRKSSKYCDDIDSNNLSNPIYYSRTISLGELSDGDYKFSYYRKKVLSEISFNIQKTDSTTLDDFVYAPISNLFIPELIFATESAQVILSGIIHSSCLQVYDHNITVKKMNNIFLIIPKATTQNSINCYETLTPLQNIVDLGEIKKAGTYLIHVRSQSGLSVNKVFRVKEKEFDPSMSSTH